MELFTVLENGGAVRDDLSVPPVKSKDRDYTVVYNGPETDVAAVYALMRQWLVDQEYRIFTENPETCTIRAKFPLWMNKPKGEQDADFVLARREGPYSDGRHPDWVELGDADADQDRRDFTVNALFRTLDGEIIDRHNSLEDLRTMTLRCVGDPEQRMREDSLRALRAIRFRITKGFTWDLELAEVMLNNDWLPDLLSSVSTERKRDELEKCFRVTTIGTLDIFAFDVSREFMWACFGDTGPNSLWLKPSMEKR